MLVAKNQGFPLTYSVYRPSEARVATLTVELSTVQPPLLVDDYMGLSENVGLIFPMIASHLKTG